jgi:hypothetical protein
VSINSVTIRGGFAPWVDTVIEWTGSSAAWTLTDTDTATVLYTGPLLRYDMTSAPETIYRLRLADDTGNIQNLVYVSPPISAPVNLTAIDIEDTSVVLTWTAVEAATAYELLVDGVSNNVLPPPVNPDPDLQQEPSLALADLETDRTYSAQIRAYMDATASLWSPLIYYTTDRTTKAESTDYEYLPYLARVRSPTGWYADGHQLVHGSGEEFGDPSGVHTTVFLYSAEELAAMRELAGVRVLSAEVSMTRFATLSDPRMVLSHWLLHDMSAIPSGAPTFVAPAMGVDSGQVALGQQAWMPLPTGWIESIIAGTAQGIGWGGVTGRYMLSPHISDPTEPRNGTLRITVG